MGIGNTKNCDGKSVVEVRITMSLVLKTFRELEGFLFKNLYVV